MLTALLVAAAVKAAVSQVTIFSDRARIQRTAEVEVQGRTKAELPLLPDTVFPDSIRLEATGAEVQKLDIEHVQPDEFPVTEARELLTKLVSQARWTPGYDLQLLQDQKSVRVSFSGEATQQTGEDWEGASMTLSTALPSTVRSLPEVATWKIGEQERFIPTPWRADRP